MPTYEFHCARCKKSFTRMLTFSEYGRGRIKCPKCGSGRVEQRLSSFTAVTSKKS